MTCEVAVMNKRGVALAADSAVTLGDGDKVYLSAEKLFPVSPIASGGKAALPVGIMTYGAAEIMGVPWETVIKLYAEKLEQRPFDRLEQYAQDFLRYIEGAQTLFSEPIQSRFFRDTVGPYWFRYFLKPLQETIEKDPKARRRAGAILLQSIKKDCEGVRANYQVLEELGDDFGERILAEYASEFTELQKEMFGPFRPTKEIIEHLKESVKLMFTRNLFEDHSSTIVFAGMGEAEALPALFQYKLGTIVAGKLRFSKADEVRVDHETDAVVVPMAQRQVIDMFYGGIWPDLRPKLVEIAKDSFLGGSNGKDKRLSDGQLKAFVERFDNALDHEIQENYTLSLTNAVAGLPRHELAGLAEALVNITIFMAKMSTGKKETVGGPVDVALISKGDGFVWVKRKEQMQSFGIG